MVLSGDRLKLHIEQFINGPESGQDLD